jgi:hypothetical protein
MRHLIEAKVNQVEQFARECFLEPSIGREPGGALHRRTMAYRVCERSGRIAQCGRPHGHWSALGAHRVAGPFSTIAMLLFLCTGTAAHPPGAEFADWFRTLQEPGTEGMMGSTSCCSPERDCQTTDYETDADGRYWITAQGVRIQVPFDKILKRTDNPTGRAVVCLRHYSGHPVVRCFIRPPES